MRLFFSLAAIALVVYCIHIALAAPMPQKAASVAPVPTVAKTSQAVSSSAHPWEHFVKPTAQELRLKLTNLQYEVTQNDGTETPFANEYVENKALGLYVDLVSGEPLFSSSDKYDSGTGWPSFVKPISKNAVVEKTDSSLGGTRTEIRSVISDDHLGHVFDDGPTDRGGLRYCMNSAALRFIPKADMAAQGYGDYIALVR